MTRFVRFIDYVHPRILKVMIKKLASALIMIDFTLSGFFEKASAKFPLVLMELDLYVELHINREMQFLQKR